MFRYPHTLTLPKPHPIIATFVTIRPYEYREFSSVQLTRLSLSPPLRRMEKHEVTPQMRKGQDDKKLTRDFKRFLPRHNPCSPIVRHREGVETALERVLVDARGAVTVVAEPDQRSARWSQYSRHQ
jgi:hypothetical protein